MTSPPRVLAFLATADARLLVTALLRNGFAVSHASPSSHPVEAIRAHSPDLVLLDMELPEVSGLEMVCRIRKDPLYHDLPVVGLLPEDGSGADKVALVAGCTSFQRYPLQAASFARNLKDVLAGKREYLSLEEHAQFSRLFADMLIEKLEIRLEAIEKKSLAFEQERSRQHTLTLQVLASLVTLIEAKDPYLKGHSGRVTRHALALAQALGVVGEDLVTLQRAALLHDIGKISIDLDHINKPGPLSETEWDLIRMHPATGFKILSAIDFLQDEALITRYHHCRFEEFPLHPEIPYRIRVLTSILSLADSFDAMTTQRSYNRPRTLQDALAELERCAGTQFDPAHVGAFVALPGLSWEEIDPADVPGQDDPGGPNGFSARASI